MQMTSGSAGSSCSALGERAERVQSVSVVSRETLASRPGRDVQRSNASFKTPIAYGGSQPASLRPAQAWAC